LLSLKTAENNTGIQSAHDTSNDARPGPETVSSKPSKPLGKRWFASPRLDGDARRSGGARVRTHRKLQAHIENPAENKWLHRVARVKVRVGKHSRRVCLAVGNG